jgi:hypothetical protein
MEDHMGKLIGVALVSACIGAGLTLLAKSTVLATSVPANVSTDGGISPHEIMKSSRQLPVETVVDPL